MRTFYKASDSECISAVIIDNHKALISFISNLNLPIALSVLQTSAELMPSVKAVVWYCHPQPYEKGRHSCISVYVIVFILLDCRRDYSAELKYMWVSNFNPTHVLTSCQRPQIIHKCKFDWLLLDKSTNNCKFWNLNNIEIQATYKTVYRGLHIKIRLPNTNTNRQNGWRKISICSENYKINTQNSGKHFEWFNVKTRGIYCRCDVTSTIK